jgi:hypothetical protein
VSQTIRLRKLQEPTYLSRLLEALIVRAGFVPLGAYQIRAATSLPTELRNIAELAVHNGRTWSCWADGTHTWMFTADMPLAISRKRRRPVLQVDVYEGDSLRDSGLWTSDRDGKWQRCTDK